MPTRIRFKQSNFSWIRGIPCTHRCQKGKHRNLQLSLCKLFLRSFANHTRPMYLCLRWVGVHGRKAALPGGHTIYFRCLEGGGLIQVVPYMRCRTRASGLDPWLVITVLENSSHSTCLCVHSFPRAHLCFRKQCWPCLFSLELPANWLRQSNHVVNDCHGGKCHCNKTQETEQG